jgi:tRNA (cmo5U34)-methyltransferase
VSQFHFSPSTYLAMIREEVPRYDELQDEVAAATAGPPVRRILDLGAGTGETAARLLHRHPAASVVLLDEHPGMLREAAARLPPERREASIHGDLLAGLPDGPFELVVSALAVHHLVPADKRALFERVHALLPPEGRFVLGDVIVPADPHDAVTRLTPDFDRPDSLDDLQRWIADAGFDTTLHWHWRDLVVLRADRVD